MTEFTVDGPALRRALVTALPFGGTDPVLPALKTVHIETDGPDRIEIAATDRYVLSLETLPVIAGTPFTVNIPRDVAKRLVAMLPKKHTPSEALIAEFSSVDDRVRVTVAGLAVDQSITFLPQDTGFPDLRKLVDHLTAKPVTEMHLTPVIVKRVMRTIRRRRGKGPVRVEFHGEMKPLVISHGDTFRCLVMPVRTPTDD